VARVGVSALFACLLIFGASVWYTMRLGTHPPVMPAAVTPAMPLAQTGEAPPVAVPVRPASEPAPEARVAMVIAPLVAVEKDPNTFRDCSSCPEMVRVPGGSFSMGNPDDWNERPVHHVTVAPFAMSRTPVTVGEWRACVAVKMCRYEPVGEDGRPASNLSWEDTQQYIQWLNQVTGKSYRLPSEAEWEFAARAGTTTSYWWGMKMIPGVANCKGCGDPYDPEQPIKAGLLRANPFGLHDMGGGVEQWVSDCWHTTYNGAPRSGSWDSPNCRERVVRGGSWRSEPDHLKVTSRAYYDTGVRYVTHGFRVALTEK
jgi:formylglycine-generating enzyme required for sulfatase activity